MSVEAHRCKISAILETRIPAEMMQPRELSNCEAGRIEK